MDFTPEQKKAIETKDCDILVSAAAGSGKTAVLVRRIIRIITAAAESSNHDSAIDGVGPVDIDRLLVVTFTEAAAAEMRQRVMNAIDDMIAEQPDNEHLKRQQMLMARASITTIHSFCLSVIRKYFYITDVDPNFRIIDAPEAELIKMETMRSFFEDLYDGDNIELFRETFGTEDNARFLRLVECYGDKVKDDGLQEMALKLYDFVQSCPWPEEWLRQSADKLCVNSVENIEAAGWYGYFVSETRMALEGALAAADTAEGLCGHDEINPLAYEALDDDREKIKNALLNLDKGFEKFYQSMDFSFATMRLALPKKKDTEESQEAKELKKRISDIRKDEIKAPITKIQKNALFMEPEGLLKNIKESNENIRTLCDIVIAFMKKFDALKRMRNIADFSDFEHLCIRTLVEGKADDGRIIPSAAAVELKNRFAEVLMDEYQDSNLVQELILSLISKKPPEGRNRFMVGDIKQSIYKFRMANPDLFREKYNSYGICGGDEIRIDLSKNFRSRESVLDGINFIFKQIMSEDLGEVKYDGNAMLNYGADYPEPVDVSVKQSELLLLDTGENGDETEETEDIENEVYDEHEDILEEITSAELEARMVASEIKKLFEESEGRTRFQVTSKDGGYKNIEKRDVVILLRSVRNVSDAYARELRNAGLDSFSDISGEYFESVEIMTILSLLRIVDNPRQDIHLISVLYSPVYGLTTDELAEIRLSLNKGMFIDCIEEYLLKDEFDRNIKNKLLKFKANLERWRDMAVYNSISDLIQTLYDDTGYFDYAGAMRGGKTRQANLTALYERALKYEQTKLKGLFNFILYIERLRKNKAEFASAKVASENDDLIRIMSIHKSKGLEFPVVFVCNMGKRFNLRDSSAQLLLHQGLGFGPMNIEPYLRVKYNTLPRYAIANKITMESLSEEMRILYVAMTRAKEKLYLTACVRDVYKKIYSADQYLTTDIAINPYRLSQKRSFMDWIIYAVLRHRDIIGSTGLDENRKFVNELYNDRSEWKIKILNKSDILKFEVKKNKEENTLRQELDSIDFEKDYSGKKEILNKYMRYEYPNQKSIEIPSKISISEIKRINYELRMSESESFENVFTKKQLSDFKQPEFMAEGAKGAEAAARRGTLMHSVMERLDFKNHYTENDVKALIHDMAEKGIISESDIKIIDTAKIAAFLETPIAGRIKKSGYVRKEIPFVLGIAACEINPDWNTNENVLVHGIIDCIFEEGGEIVLLDYKSDRINESGVQKAVEKYKIQLSIYKKAIESSLGMKVKESLIYFFGLNQEYSVL